MAMSIKPNTKPPSEYGTPDRWFVLSLLAVNYFTLYLHRNLINYLQPALIADLKLTDTELGLLHWSFLFAYALSQVFVGFLSDRFRRRTLLLGSLASSVAVLIAMGFAGGFVELLMLRVLLAVTQSASVPAIAGIVADCFTPKTRSTAVSVYLLSSPFSLIAAGWLGGKVGDAAGWRVATFAFGGFGALFVVVLFALLREPPRTEREDAMGLGKQGAPLVRTLASVLTVKSFVVLAIAYVLVANVSQITMFWLPRYFHEQFGMNMEESGRMATLWSQLGTVGGLLAGGAWADHWSRQSMSGRFMVQLIGLFVCIPALFVMGWSQNQVLLILAMFVFGFASWLYFANLWTTTFEVVDPAARSTAIGLLNVASGVLGAWMSPLVGYLREQRVVESLRSVFLAMALLIAISSALIAFLIVKLLARDFRGPATTKVE